MTINVRKFVYDNITPYDGDASFLSGPTERTKKLMEEVKKYLKEERDNNGLRSVEVILIKNWKQLFDYKLMNH